MVIIVLTNDLPCPESSIPKALWSSDYTYRKALCLLLSLKGLFCWAVISKTMHITLKLFLTNMESKPPPSPELRWGKSCTVLFSDLLTTNLNKTYVWQRIESYHFDVKNMI